MNVKPYHVFSVEGQAYLVKLLSNRVFVISSDESYAFRLFEEKQQPLPLSLVRKYGLESQDGDWESRRKRRWENIFSQRKAHCVELMVAQECNMRCDYCYGDVHFGGSGLMDWPAAKHAVDWFLAAAGNEPRPKSKPLLISFFGGEPLLNFSIIKKTVEYVWGERARRDVTFSVTTNLSLLTDDMLAFMVKYPMGLCISFDGSMQHKYRRFAAGGDSYDTVVSNIKKALSVMPDSSGRATLYGEGNMDDMADDLREVGFSRGYITAASGSLMSGRILKNKEDAYQALVETYPAFTRRYLRAIRERDERAYRRIAFDSEFMQAVGFGWNPPSNMMSCGCGRTLYAVDVKGDIYPCHRFVGVPEMKLGNVDAPEPDTGSFAEHITFVNPGCKSCFLRFTCGGSCMHENYCDASAAQKKPSLHTPFPSFCKYRRLTAQLAIHVEYSLDDGDKAWLRQLEHGKQNKEL